MKKIPIVIFGLVITFSLIFASSSEGKNMDAKAKETLKVLMDGNARYVEGKMLHPRQGADRRMDVAAGQHPVAIIVSCSDSRVPPEIIFDQGLGDLFVVRVAGNVLNDVNIGTIEYGAEHLGPTLIMVLGHKRCGAVIAAVKGGELPDRVQKIVDAITPAIDDAKKRCKECDLVEMASHINVERAVKALQGSEPILSHLVKEGKLSIVGGYYDLDTGKVEILSK